MTRRDRQAQKKYLATTAGKVEKSFSDYALGRVKKNHDNKRKKEADKEGSCEPASCR